MEPNLQELVNQIGTDVSGKWIAVDRVGQLADLIVQECIRNLYLNGYDDAMIQIQKHFGME
jgi:hypothetical protein